MIEKHKKTLEQLIELGKKTNFANAERILHIRLSHLPRIESVIHYLLWEALEGQK